MQWGPGQPGAGPVHQGRGGGPGAPLLGVPLRGAEAGGGQVDGQAGGAVRGDGQGARHPTGGRGGCYSYTASQSSVTFLK